MGIYLQEQFLKNMKESWDDYDEDKYSLVGQDGNAFALMGYTARCMKECGLRTEVKEMQDKAMSGDYNNLIAVCNDYVQKCNEIARNIDLEEACGNKSRKKLKEARWDYTLKCGSALRKAIHDGNVQEVINQLWNGYKELKQADIIDDWQYDSYTEDLIDSEYWDEDELEDNADWALNNFYDLCDNANVWIPLNENLISEFDWDMRTDDVMDDYYDGKISEEEKDKKLKNLQNKLDEEFTSEIWNKLSGSEQYAVETALDIIRQGAPIEDAVMEGVMMVNGGNSEPEYEGEDFYEDEVDYSKIFNAVSEIIKQYD